MYGFLARKVNDSPTPMGSFFFFLSRLGMLPCTLGTTYRGTKGEEREVSGGY